MIGECNGSMRLLLTGIGVAALAAATEVQAQTAPAARTVVEKACAVAGGMPAFRAIGVLRVEVDQEEVTTDGTPTHTQKTLIFTTPGPLPGRVEIAKSSLVAADDGSGGWAVQAGTADPRPLTKVMVKRTLATQLLPLTMPFSLLWPEVQLSGVVAEDFKGRKAWRVDVEFPTSFFTSPQISTKWVVWIDQQTSALVAASAPGTDLGHGIQADGMLFSWAKPVTIKGVRFAGEQRVTGVDTVGREKPHSRIDRVTYTVMKTTEAAALFANPNPDAGPGLPQMPASAPPRS